MRQQAIVFQEEGVLATAQSQCWGCNGDAYIILYFINSLRPSDAIWLQGYGSTLVQVMACCLTAPSHYLDQRWLFFCKVWHLAKGVIIIWRSGDTNKWNKIKHCIFKNAYLSPRGQWVNMNTAPQGLMDVYFPVKEGHRCLWASICFPLFETKLCNQSFREGLEISC